MKEASESRGHENSDIAIVEIKIDMTLMIVNIMMIIILFLIIVLLINFFSYLPNIPSLLLIPLPLPLCPFFATHSSPSPSLSLLYSSITLLSAYSLSYSTSFS